jgi:uncharacterized OsmC-like protein
MNPSVSGTFAANKKLALKHALSGQELTTDLTPSQGGGGKSFSPTDLLAASVVSCMGTLGGIAAEREGVDLKGAKVEVEKRIDYQDAASGANPRIQGFQVTFHLPKSMNDKQRKTFEAAVHRCPVTHALKSEVEVSAHFLFDI